MYNENIKERYIDEKTAVTVMSNRYLDRLFGRTEEFEEKLNKDVSCFAAHEIRNMYATWNIGSPDFLINLHSNLNQYTRWALTQGLVNDSQNHYEEIERKELIMLINQVKRQKAIITEETLNEWINLLSEPCDKFLLRALFEGIAGKDYCELVNLKINDFTSYGTVKLCTGREIKVSYQLYLLAKQSAETYEYCGNNGEAKRTYPLYGEGMILKELPQVDPTSTDFQKGRRTYNKALKIFSWLGVNKWMTMNSLCDSGRIHWLLKTRKDLGINPRDIFYGLDSNGNKSLAEEFNHQFGGKFNTTWFVKYESFLS